jgi:hypothetical protein
MTGQRNGGEYGPGFQTESAQLHHFFHKGIAALQGTVRPHSVNGNQNNFFAHRT